MNLNQRGQSSFEILLLVAFVTGLSVLVVAGYFEIAPSIFGTAIVKSALLREITAQSPETILISVDYQRSHNLNEFNVQTLPNNLPCNTFNISDQTPVLFQSANDSLVRINNCESALIKAKVSFNIPSGQTAESVAQACRASGFVPSLDVQTTGVSQKITFAISPDVEQSRLVNVESGSSTLKATFGGDCCLGYVNSSCTGGGYDITIVQARLGSVWSNDPSQTLYENTKTATFTFPSS